MTIGALPLGGVASTHNHLFCCCKKAPEVESGNAGGQTSESERPPGVNPFLRIRPPESQNPDVVAIENLADHLADSGFTPYQPDELDAALADQFDRIEQSARQAISEFSSNLPTVDLRLGIDIEDDEMLAVMIAMGLFDDDECCC